MEIREISPEEFSCFSATCPDSFYNQTIASYQVNLAQGLDSHLLGLYDAERLRAVCKIFYLPWKKIFKTAEIYYGPLFQEPSPALFSEFLTALAVYFRKQPRLIRCRLAPLIKRSIISDNMETEADPEAAAYDQALADHGFKRLMIPFQEQPGLQADFLYVKDIDGLNEEEMFASISGKCRTNMRKAKSYGVQVRFLEASEFDLFRDMLRNTIQRTGMPEFVALPPTAEQAKYFGDNMLVPLAYLDLDHSEATLRQEIADYDAELERLAEQEQGRRTVRRIKDIGIAREVAEGRLAEIEEFFNVHDKLVPLASSLYFFTPSDCIYLSSASYDEAFNFSAVYAIHEVMLKKAVEAGVKRYNMFGVTDPLVDENGAAGVLNFKKNFNGYTLQLLGNYEWKRF